MITSFENSRGSVPAALVLGLCLMGAAGIGAYSFYKVHTLDNTLAVTGSATQDAKADSATLTVSLSQSVSESVISTAQQAVSSDAERLSNFFVKGGIAEADVSASPVFIDPEYSSDNNAPRRYNIHADVTVRSKDTALVERIAKDIGTFPARGSIVSGQAPQYIISTLPEIRVALIGKAVEDAKKRAEQIAKATGRSVGSLQSAASGVVQVLSPNSVDVADYGSYDTSTIDKKVMVTARATFYLK